MKHCWEDIAYRIVAILLSLFVAFVIGWYSASRYTLITMKAWYQPESDNIMIQDYMGNIDAHYGLDPEEMVAIWKEQGRLK